MAEHAVLCSANPKAFFNYARKRVVLRDSLGSLKRTDDMLTSDTIEIAEILKKIFLYWIPMWGLTTIARS